MVLVIFAIENLFDYINLMNYNQVGELDYTMNMIGLIISTLTRTLSRILTLEISMGYLGFSILMHPLVWASPSLLLAIPSTRSTSWPLSSLFFPSGSPMPPLSVPIMTLATGE